MRSPLPRSPSSLRKVNAPIRFTGSIVVHVASVLSSVPMDRLSLKPKKAAGSGTYIWKLISPRCGCARSVRGWRHQPYRGRALRARVVGYDIDPVALLSRFELEVATRPIARRSPISVRGCPRSSAPFTRQMCTCLRARVLHLFGSSVELVAPVERPLKSIPITSWCTARKRVSSGYSARAATRCRNYLSPARDFDVDVEHVPLSDKEPLNGKVRCPKCGAVSALATAEMRQHDPNGGSSCKSILKKQRQCDTQLQGGKQG